MSDIPWFKVDDTFAFHPKTLAATNAALGLWVRAGAWCSANLTGGRVPTHVLGILGAQKRDAKRLVDAGLWSEVDGGYQFHDWDQYQPSKADIEAERRANRERQRRWREAQRTGESPDQHTGSTAAPPQPNTDGTFTHTPDTPGGVEQIGENTRETGHRNTVTNAVTNAVSNDPPSRPIPSSSSSANAAAAKNDRPDITALCEHLSERLTANEVKHTVTEKWRTEARLLLDRDKRDPRQAHFLIDWATSDSFWKGNIHSMPKFREKYDQLRIKASADRPQTRSPWDDEEMAS